MHDGLSRLRARPAPRTSDPGHGVDCGVIERQRSTGCRSRVAAPQRAEGNGDDGDGRRHREAGLRFRRREADHLPAPGQTVPGAGKRDLVRPLQLDRRLRREGVERCPWNAAAFQGRACRRRVRVDGRRAVAWGFARGGWALRAGRGWAGCFGRRQVRGRLRSLRSGGLGFGPPTRGDPMPALLGC